MFMNALAIEFAYVAYEANERNVPSRHGAISSAAFVVLAEMRPDESQARSFPHVFTVPVP